MFKGRCRFLEFNRGKRQDDSRISGQGVRGAVQELAGDKRKHFGLAFIYGIEGKEHLERGWSSL